MTDEVDEMSAASRGSHGDTLSVLRTLIDGVRGMGLGDPDSGDRVDASDIVRWAVDEIEQQRGSLQWLHGLVAEAEERLANLRLTDEEREAIQRAIDSHQHRAAEMHSRSWAASAIKNDCDTLRALLD